VTFILGSLSADALINSNAFSAVALYGFSTVGEEVACFFQASFLPCLVQMKFEFFDFLTCPTFVHNAPALTAAFAWIAGMDTREIESSATISFWGAHTGEVSQGKPRETITIESRNDAALVGSPA